MSIFIRVKYVAGFNSRPCKHQLGHWYVLRLQTLELKTLKMILHRKNTESHFRTIQNSFYFYHPT